MGLALGSPVRHCAPMVLELGETCSICGGDGRIGNSLGSTKVCPGCRGSGRRAEDDGFRDVTKTKPSHYAKQANPNEPAAAKPTVPVTGEGIRLATEVRDCDCISDDLKVKLVREIVGHEATHSVCTKTFKKKVRKQLKPAAS